VVVLGAIVIIDGTSEYEPSLDTTTTMPLGTRCYLGKIDLGDSAISTCKTCRRCKRRVKYFQVGVKSLNLIQGLG
jgi:hypothetical protein